MANVMFKKGLLAQLPSTYSEGTFYVTTDERAIYLDVSDEKRIRLGDFQEFTTVEALEANTNPSTSALYYVTDINCLAKWDGTKYVQINRDTGATSFEVVGDGNAVTAVSYNATTRKLTLTKGETFAPKSFVGSIPEGYTEETVIAYINKKAEETLASATGGSSESAASVLAALNTYKAENDPKVAQAQKDIDALEEKVGDTSVSAQITSAIEALDLANTYDAKGAAADVQSALNTYKTSNDAAVAAAQKAGDDAQAAADIAQDAVDDLKAKVGTVPADKTVVEMIADAQTAATYDDTQVKADIKANKDAIDILNGSGDGSVDKKIDDAFNDFATKVSDDGVVNSYKELIDWAAEHGGDAAEMASAISALEAIVDGIGDVEAGEKATVVAYVSDAIDALKIGDYAKAADLTSLAGRVSTIEADYLKAADKTELSKAISDEKTRAEGAETALSGRLDVLETIDHEAYKAYADQAEADALSAAKTYADGLAGNYDAKGAADDALAAAKTYADGLAGNYDAKGDAAAAETAAKAYTDEKVAASVLTWGTF